jgi:hypothetical protein
MTDKAATDAAHHAAAAVLGRGCMAPLTALMLFAFALFAFCIVVDLVAQAIDRRAVHTKRSEDRS